MAGIWFYRKYVRITIFIVILLSMTLPFDSATVQAAQTGSGSRAAIVKIAAGFYHQLAIRSDGGVIAWGNNVSGQTNVPPEAQSDVVAVAAGEKFSLALRSNGSVVAWGFNGSGQTSVPPEAQSGIVAITAGMVHSLALKSGGSVVGWGGNAFHQTDVPPEAQSGVVAIAAGAYHSLALKSNGSVVAWADNVYGQSNVPPAAQSDVVAIAAGGYHSLALKSDGSVVAWGANGVGQTMVPPQAQSGVVAIAAGGGHSLALKSDGSVVAWGQNANGQATVPTEAQSEVVAIAAGESHSLALKADNTYVVWGNNNLGQADVPASNIFPVKGGRIAAGGSFSLALKSDGGVIAWGSDQFGALNVPMDAQSGVVRISAGTAHSLAVKSDGTLVAWGSNNFGQLNAPPETQSGLADVAAGFNFSAALKNDGSVIAWGNSYDGQTTVPPEAQSGVAAISAGDSHVVALKSDGSVVAWGFNEYGQATVPATAQSDVIAVSAGEIHSLALKNDGSVVAWGYNGDDQTTVPSEAQSGVVAIAAGGYHSLALKSDGSVVAWGSHALGLDTVPTEAKSGVVAIAAGTMHSLALKSDGTVVAWGSVNSSEATTVPGSSGLAGLAINTGAIIPHFSASTASYTSYVRESESSVNVTANLADDASARVIIDGQVQPSGGTVAVSLTGDSTVIPVQVSPYLLPDKLYSIHVIKDATIPNVAVAMTKSDGSAYVDDTWTNQAVSVSVEATDDVSVSSITYSKDGGASWSLYTGSPIELTGSHVYPLLIKATDLAGNEAVASRNVKISTGELTLTPTLTLAGGAPYASGAWTNQDVTASVYAESGASGIADLTYTINGAPSQAYANQSPILLNQEGTQAIVFQVTDTAGNTLTAPLSVNIDRTLPVITLNGPSSVTLTKGSAYVEQNADATDNVGLEGAVNSSGAVDTNVAGTYIVRYNVSDLAGNAAVEVTRTVVVRQPQTSTPAIIDNKPMIELNGVTLDPATIDTAQPSVTLEVAPKDGIVDVIIPASILTGVEGQNATFFIEIKTPYGSYQVPVNLASLIPGLADLLAKNNLKAEDISFQITLTDKSSDKDIQAAFANRFSQGEAMGAVVDFHVTIANTKTRQSIGTADTFSEALTRVIPMQKNMANMPEQWGAFRYSEKTKTFEFIPATKARIDGVWYAMLRSYSNSVYVVAHNPASFTDVQRHWSRSFVELAAAKGLVYGIGGGNYAPDQAVTRAEFSALLVRALGRGTNAGGTAPYEDVKPGAWYYADISKAKELGLLDFASGKFFKPDQPLTREEMASMLAAAISLEKPSVTKEFVSLDGYQDIGSVDTAYLENVRLMVKLQIMTGTSDHTFNPKSETTRAQAASVLIRTLLVLGTIDE